MGPAAHGPPRDIVYNYTSAWIETKGKFAQKYGRGHGAASRALLAPGSADFDSGTRLGRAMLAVRLAPDLPFARMALARAHWDEGERAAALEEVVAALRAIPRDLEATFWLAS